MFSEFKAFIARGNVLDLAVAVIIGAAFGAIVTSLTGDVIMPVIGALFGGADLSNHFILLSAPDGYTGSMTDYAALKEAGAAMIGYGAFLTALLNFLIIAFVVWRISKAFLPPAPAPDGPIMKTCPYCRMACDPQATRCPHCTSDLGAVAAP